MNLVDTFLELVSIESETGKEEKILDYINKFLVENKFEGEILRNSGGIIAIPTKSSKKIGLVGHVDTVPVVPNQQYEFNNDDVVGGRGTVDMKGGISIMMHSLIENPSEIISIFYTAEESSYEDNGLNIIMPTLLNDFDLEFAIILEPTNNEIQLGCLGALNATLTLHGKAAHSARPWVGENPVYKVNEVIKLVQDNEINELDIDGLQFKQVMSITKISSGIANNVIPEDLKLNLNFRYSPEINGETASEYIRDLFSNHSDVDIVNTSDGAMPNMGESEINYFIEKTGAVVQPKQAWTDIARFYQNNIPCLNFGPGDPLLAHATNEHISKRQLLESYELLSNYFKDKSE